MYFGADYYPEHRDPEFWDFDLDNMQQANINCLRIAEFAWSRFEPVKNEFRFEWLGKFAKKAAKRNIDLLMCVPFRTAPAWMVEEEPGILMTLQDGHRLEFGSRYTFCINHAYFREREVLLAEKQGEFFRDTPNICGWHLCNEHGDEWDCHCPVCKTEFQLWLKEKYNSIDSLNKRWGLAFWSLEFNHFEQIPTPALSKTFHNPALIQNWREFRSHCTIDAVDLQAQAIKPFLRPEQFITTNNQPLWNNRTDYFKMAEKLDICGTNYYPPYGENMRAISLGLSSCLGYKQQQKYLVLELRNGPHMIHSESNNTPTPGEIERITMHCYANGANGTFYFRYKACPFGCEQAHGTLVGFNGKPKQAYYEAQTTGGKLNQMAAVIDNTRIESEIAFLYDFPSRWLMETAVRWTGNRELYIRFAKQLHEVLDRLPYNVHTISRYDDFAKYRVLVVPLLAPVEDELAEKLKAFVNNGGTLVWHPLSAIKNNDANIYPDRLHPALKQLFQVDIQEYATLGSDESATFEWNGKTYSTTAFCDLPDLEGAEAIAQFTSSFYTGTPALVHAKSGEGEVFYIMSFAEKSFHQDFFAKLMEDLAITPIMLPNIPEAIEAKEHVDPSSGKRYLFLISHSANDITIPSTEPYRDVYNNELISTDITMPAYGSRVITQA